MTIIAWDGATLAADKRAIIGGGLIRTVTKIWRHAGVLLAVTGDWDTAAEMREWFKDGAKPALFPPKARRDGAATLIVITGFSIEVYCSGPFPVLIEDDACCWGSGRDYALAALHMGGTARTAVEVACVYQSDCGNGIDCLTLGPAVT
jgi:hypothetical protein